MEEVILNLPTENREWDVDAIGKTIKKDDQVAFLCMRKQFRSGVIKAFPKNKLSVAIEYEYYGKTHTCLRTTDKIIKIEQQ